MRLTLRTLLSYLDDTLEPSQAKAIGAKVAESEQARELMERIKQVTRRRRLGTPPTAGPGGIDANTIAEYLNDDGTPEKAAEVEQICLASDVHLAEVAACHQILTLVLGEPALVPPSAKQRMYGLVKGPESIPFRKPAKPAAKDDQDLSSELEPEQDETLRLGVPAVGGANRNLLLLVGGGVLAACLLVVAIWQIVGNVDFHRGGIDVVQNDGKEKEKEKEKDKEPEKLKEPEKVTEKPKPEETPTDPNLAITIGKPADSASSVIKYEPANMQPIPVGHYVAPGLKEPTVLLQQNDKKKWERLWNLGKNERVLSGRPLLSLSGSKSVVLLDSGVEMTLWGNLPEATLDPSVLESRLIVHANPQLDADFTLERGRVLLRNKKAGGKYALVRVRFINPMHGKEDHFEITLNGTEAATIVDRSCFLDANEPFHEDRKDKDRLGPTAIMKVFAYERSSASVVYNDQTTMVSELQKPMLQWQSREGVLGPPSKAFAPPWIKGLPELQGDAKVGRDKAIKAHEAVAKLCETKPFDVALAEFQGTIQAELAREKVLLSLNTFVNWRHVIRCRAAVDDVSLIYDDLQQETTPFFIRVECIDALKQWLSWDRDNDYQLLDALRIYHNKLPVRVKIMELFHPISKKAADDPATYMYLVEELNNNLMPIRMLSRANLAALPKTRAGGQILYDPAMTRAQRIQAIALWHEFLSTGRLPAPPTKKDKG